eukprot:m.345493 g.345493  ORF g.345493 m.345493 type:complete len:74 (-) comp26542_c0_seq1:1119-1340(-)
MTGIHRLQFQLLLEKKSTAVRVTPEAGIHSNPVIQGVVVILDVSDVVGVSVGVVVMEVLVVLVVVLTVVIQVH